MILKNVKILLLFSLTLLVVSNAYFVSSQYAIPNEFHGSYKVRTGDSNRYDITYANTTGQNYYSFPFIMHNGTVFFLNLTQEDSLNFKVTGLNTSSPNSTQVYMIMIVTTQHHTISQYQLTNFGLFINPGFDNFTDAQQYENQNFQYLRGQSYAMYMHGSISFTHNKDFIMFTYDYWNASIYDINSTGPFTTQIMISFNWKTGWLNYLTILETDSNFKVNSDIFIQRHSPTTSLTTVFNSVTGLVEVGSLVVVVAVIVIVVLSYYSYSKERKRSNKTQSFVQYLKNRFFYRKKNTQRISITETEKSLQTIETILEETSNKAD